MQYVLSDVKIIFEKKNSNFNFFQQSFFLFYQTVRDICFTNILNDVLRIVYTYAFNLKR